MKTFENDRLDAEERHELPDSAFGIPETREFPIPDAAHVRAAEAYFRYAPEDKKAQLARFILQKADEFGVKVSSSTVLSYITRLDEKLIEQDTEVLNPAPESLDWRG